MVNLRLIIDVVEKALALDLAFLSTSGGVRHVPFALTPCPVDLSDFATGQKNSVLLGRLTQALANDSELIHSLHEPLTEADPFFAELLSMHSELTEGNASLPRLPLLLQRSDFMLDIENGPQLVECNSIAAGMAPFGEQVQHLHEYVRQKWPREFAQFTADTNGIAVANDSIAHMSEAIATAAQQIRTEHNDGGAPSFLMVIQENEDNVFDQFILERELNKRGVRTVRRTFRELHEQLSSGSNERLLLQGHSAIDVVYLRAGYQYRDYLAVDLDTRRCCDALRETRIFIERHRVAVNATVAQQLATSKRTQQYLSEAPAGDWLGFGLRPEEVQCLKAAVTEMRSVDRSTTQWLQDAGGTENWVLKNQGEGGGHCLFDESILKQLEDMPEGDYAAWTLMRRLRPVGRQTDTVLVRDGKGENMQNLVSELGFFTAHLAGHSLLGSGEDKSAYLGYLVRSKPPAVTEGGIHSGYGVLDSLICA